MHSGIRVYRLFGIFKENAKAPNIENWFIAYDSYSGAGAAAYRFGGGLVNAVAQCRLRLCGYASGIQAPNNLYFIPVSYTSTPSRFFSWRVTA